MHFFLILSNIEGVLSGKLSDNFSLQFQLAAFASKYIQGSNLPSVSKLTADHVANMGHFLCGLTASDIRLIPNEVYE